MPQNWRIQQAKGQVRGAALASLARDTSANTFIMVAGVIAPLLAIMGGAVDMGRGYLSETRLQQACDAGVLAARKQLGSSVAANGSVPADVETTGQSFFNLNFRNGAYGTLNRDFKMTLEPDYSISGIAKVDVPTTIMQVFGFHATKLQTHCEAALNFNDTDIMMVLDTTTSMLDTNPSDTEPKLNILKSVVKSFHAQLEGSKGPDTRIRYGFVPYSTNVNVGDLLDDKWVVSNWTYQSRTNDHVDTVIDTTSFDDNWALAAGTSVGSVYRTYPATYHPPVSGTSEYDTGSGEWWSCDIGPPPDTAIESNKTLVSTDTNTAWAGPPPGTRTVEHWRTTFNGIWYSDPEQSGTTCTIWKTVNTNAVFTFDWITQPRQTDTQFYRYAPVARDVSNWRAETNKCVEERKTYEITNYSAPIDFSRALDLDLDLVPDPTKPDTQWRPMYPDIIYERSLDYWGGSGSFTVAPVVSSYDHYLSPGIFPALVACPDPARKLAEMDNAAIDSYIDPITANGTTYHDIGMIWGGRLISKDGLFAAENADRSGHTTRRHLIFLTDGQTEPFDVAYGAYGIEPLDRRRWSKSSALKLDQTVENRFDIACQQVKNHNVTVWVIGFGTTMTPLMKRCAGSGHWFQANNASQLSLAFSNIASSMGDLRISK